MQLQGLDLKQANLLGGKMRKLLVGIPLVCFLFIGYIFLVGHGLIIMEPVSIAGKLGDAIGISIVIIISSIFIGMMLIHYHVTRKIAKEKKNELHKDQ